MTDENRWVRWYSIEALGNMGPEAASEVGVLVPLLKHPDDYTRRQAVEALGRIGVSARQAISPLMNVLDNDRDTAVRKAAGVALHQINLKQIADQAFEQADEEVRELIHNLRTGDDNVATAAASALGQMGAEGAAAVPDLALVLQHKSKAVRAAAATALGRLDTAARDVLPALQAAAYDPEPEVRAAASKAIPRIEAK